MNTFAPPKLDAALSTMQIYALNQNYNVVIKQMQHW